MERLIVAKLRRVKIGLADAVGSACISALRARQVRLSHANIVFVHRPQQIGQVVIRSFQRQPRLFIVDTLGFFVLAGDDIARHHIVAAFDQHFSDLSRRFKAGIDHLIGQHRPQRGHRARDIAAFDGVAFQILQARQFAGLHSRCLSGSHERSGQGKENYQNE
jgi:hypothetical protein